MGRLGPLNSLAFGRSPFQPPEHDENGAFILGPHAHDTDNNDFYAQEFDERGHPKNNASKALTRAMQHAQNAVLETVGVVVRKEEASKSAWQRQSKKAKMEDIINENSHGIVMREVGPFFIQSSMWWVISLRRRIQTFRSYVGLPVLHIIRKEVRTFGTLSFFANGLLPAIASYVLNILVIGIRSRNLEVAFEITLQGKTTTWRPFNIPGAGLIAPLIVFPAKAYAVLQSLHLIPSSYHLNPWSFVPFTAASPIQTPAIPDIWSAATILTFATAILYHPFIISLVSDMTKSYIHNALYRITLLTLTPKPDRPDDLTIKAGKQDREDDDSLSLAGIGPGNNTERLSIARSNDYWTEIGRELGYLAARIKPLIKFITRQVVDEQSASPQASLLPEGVSHDRLRARCAEMQRHSVREHQGDLRSNTEERLHHQRQAIAWAMAEFGVVGDFLGGAADDFLLEPHELFGSESTATPEPVDPSGHATTQSDFPNQLPQLSSPEILQVDYREADPRHSFRAHLRALYAGPGSLERNHDIAEREGEGRVMASLGYQDNIVTSPLSASSPSTRSELIEVDVVRRRDEDLDSNDMEEPSPELLQNPFDTASDLMRESVIEEATRLAPEETGIRGVIEAPSYISIEGDSPGAGMTAEVDDHPMFYPEVPWLRISNPDLEGRRQRARTRSIPLQANGSQSTLALRQYSSLSSDDGAVHDSKPGPRHRVTMLSMFPAEIFAECFAGLITSVVTLPLDTLYVRSLALGFLGAPYSRPGAAAACLGLRGNAYGMSDWFGGSSEGWKGESRYAGLMTLILGVHGCVSMLTWAVVTKLAIWSGTETGWGQL